MISVITPTLNEGKYMEKLMKALKAQDNQDFEVIVSDSHSDDNTAAIAKKYGARVVLSERLGPGVGRNIGAKAAKGEILLFIDADTTPSPQLLSKVKAVLEKRKNVIGGTCQFYPSQGNVIDWFIYAITNAAARAMIASGTPQDPGYCFFYRREVFEKLGGLRTDLSFNETHDLAMRSRPYGKFTFLKAPVFTSLRRYRKLGYLKTIKTYLGSTIYYLRTGETPAAKFEFKPVR
ncbi:MAG: glycosyltransferase [Candidatus Hadarchaeota archaeon]